MLCRKSGGGGSAGLGSSAGAAVAMAVTAGVPGPSAALAAGASALTSRATTAPLAIFTRPLGPVPVRIGTNLQEKSVIDFVRRPAQERHERRIRKLRTRGRR